MIRKVLIRIVIALGFVSGILFVTIKAIDKTPYRASAHYSRTIRELDSVDWLKPADTLKVGFSKVSITPKSPVPLAGYGARKPKEFDNLQDSCFVRTVVFESGNVRVAFISAELLIIHPEVRLEVERKLAPDWKPDELFFTATHTHSGYGGWAPGIVGALFAGGFNESHVDFISDKIAEAVNSATPQKSLRLLYGELAVHDHVKNRLVGSTGEIDPWLKVIKLATDDRTGFLTTYSAHATCLGVDSRAFSGDYPSRLMNLLEKKSDFAAFAAGAVGSMGPVAGSDSSKIDDISRDLAEQVFLLENIGMAEMPQNPMRSFRIPIYPGDPAFKISESLALRPWLFRLLVGEYPVYISVLQIGELLILGFPCDFSGELALPLYKEARQNGLHLIITSFNGGYMGYVPKDKWYNLDKYETRTMSWYGPNTGAFFSEIASQIINRVSQSK